MDLDSLNNITYFFLLLLGQFEYIWRENINYSLFLAPT